MLTIIINVNNACNQIIIVSCDFSHRVSEELDGKLRDESVSRNPSLLIFLVIIPSSSPPPLPRHPTFPVSDMLLRILLAQSTQLLH